MQNLSTTTGWLVISGLLFAGAGLILLMIAIFNPGLGSQATLTSGVWAQVLLYLGGLLTFLGSLASILRKTASAILEGLGSNPSTHTKAETDPYKV